MRPVSLHALCSIALAGGLAACSAPPAKVIAPAETEKTPGMVSTDSYPAGPYGNVQGQIIKNLALVAKRDDNANGKVTDDPARIVRIGDYRKDYKVLVMTMSAQWCPPCMAEQPELVQMYKDYKAMNAGVAVLESLIEKTNGAPPDVSTIDAWGDAFNINFDVAADATTELGPYFFMGAVFPTQMVLTTHDMQIRWQSNSVNDADLRGAIDDALSASP